MPVETVVHQITQRPAAHFGWLDRGVVAPGYLADLNVIDLEHLECAPPEIATDLPAGGRRLLQAATGYRWTVKRGAVTFEDGVHTGELPGQLVRGAQTRAGQGPRLTAARRPRRPSSITPPPGPDRPAVKDLERDLSYARAATTKPPGWPPARRPRRARRATGSPSSSPTRWTSSWPRWPACGSGPSSSRWR